MSEWGAFDPQPLLGGEAIRLRPLVEGDWDGLFAVAADPLIWALHPSSDRWQEPVFRTYFEAGLESGGCLTVENLETGELIGSSRYSRSYSNDGEIEIGSTFLARACWGGPINAELKRLMVAHALEHFDAVIFLVGEDNLRSRRALEKIGASARSEKRLFEQMGRPVAHLVYEIRHVPE